MTVFAYIRVSTDKQDCENQKVGVVSKAAELGLTINYFIEDDGISGTVDPENRALGQLMHRICSGDVIICSELSRLGRKLFMIMRILEQCMARGVRVYTVKDGYELGDNIQSKVLAFAFALSAEIERDLISQRTREAIARRKMDGAHVGRASGSRNKQYKLSGKEKYIKTQLIRGMPKREIARRLGVATKTLRDFIGRF